MVDNTPNPDSMKAHIRGHDMNDKRIKLAEAMGWDRINYIKRGSSKNRFLSGRGIEQPRNGQFGMRQIPDPFTNADDDYAVLEWMRSNDFAFFEEFAQEVYALLKAVPVHYTIGDYARAALKVLP